MKIKDNNDIRKLTSEECLLFQGFNVDDNCHTHSLPEFTIDDKGKKELLQIVTNIVSWKLFYGYSY